MAIGTTFTLFILPAVYVLFATKHHASPDTELTAEAIANAGSHKTQHAASDMIGEGAAEPVQARLIKSDQRDALLARGKI